MKWTIARRFMLPVRRKRRFFYRRNYKQIFFMKQQIKNFYGKLQEYKIRNLFKNVWYSNQNFKNQSFFLALEQRLDVVLYRMRFLPTIYANNQLISHQGILVNNQLVTIPSYKVRIGDIISLQKDHWILFYGTIYVKLLNRLKGKNIQNRRLKKLLLKRFRLFKWRKNFILHTHLRREYNLYLTHKLKRLFNKKMINSTWKKNLIKNKSKFLKSKYRYMRYKSSNYLNKWTLFKFSKDLFINYNQKKKFFQLKKLSENLKNNKLTFEKIITNNFDNSLVEYNIKNKSQNNLNTLNSNLIKYSIKKNFFQKQAFLKLMQLIKKKHFKVVKQKKYRLLKKREKRFFTWRRKPHWYVPTYLEFDANTLRVGLLYKPEASEINYAFECSLEKLISFYKDRGL